MESENKDGNQALSLQKEVGTRLGRVASMLGTRKYSAYVADVSVDMLSRYIKGSSKQSFVAIARMCEMANVSMEWVWSGEGEMLLSDSNQIKEGAGQYHAQKRHSYLEALDMIEAVYKEKGTDIKPGKLTQLVSLVAEELEKEDTEQSRSRILQLVALAA